MILAGRHVAVSDMIYCTGGVFQLSSRNAYGTGDIREAAASCQPGAEDGQYWGLPGMEPASVEWGSGPTLSKQEQTPI